MDEDDKKDKKHGHLGCGKTQEFEEELMEEVKEDE